MSFQTSHSKNSCYIRCSRHWYLSYIEGWEASAEGASLPFGIAIDGAVMAMLSGNQKYLNIFYDLWTKSFNFGQATQVFDNPDIVYSNTDFDPDVLESPADFIQLESWAKQLNLVPLTNMHTNEELINLFNDIRSRKKNPYKTTTKDEMTFFSRCSWLSLKRKGKILLEAFNIQFLPKIKKVHSTQVRSTIEDIATGDKVVGYVDMVLELDGYDKPIIFDLKTASKPYDQDDIDFSQQLTLYSAMKRNEFNTDLVGYVVLCKNIQKEHEYYCKTCGHIKNSKHTTCNNTINGVRCNGEWLEKLKLKPEVQVIIEKKTEDQVNDVLADIGNLILAMKSGIHYKNVDQCSNWFGSDCCFKKLCWQKDSTGLKKKK